MYTNAWRKLEQVFLSSIKSQKIPGIPKILRIIHSFLKSDKEIVFVWKISSNHSGKQKHKTIVFLKFFKAKNYVIFLVKSIKVDK